MTDKIKEAAEAHANSLGHQSDKEQYGTTPWCEWNIRERSFIAGATSEAAREYWEGQKDEEIARLTQKVEFYRQTTDKVRELIFSRNDIGQPCQPLYDCIYDKITSQDSEIARLKEDVKELVGALNKLRSTAPAFYDMIQYNDIKKLIEKHKL